MKKIFSAAINIHDHNTYDGVFHHQAERYTRKKHNLNLDNPHDPTFSRDFFLTHILWQYYRCQRENEIFSFSVSNLGQEFVIDLIEKYFQDTNFLNFKPNNLWDYYQTDNYYYIDHHQSHATYAYLTSEFEESDILAIDGRGWQFNCIFIDKHGNIKDLSDKLSIGGLWNRIAQDLGFGYLGAGKVMGLAGYGRYCHLVDAIVQAYLLNPNHKLPDYAHRVLRDVRKEDIAFTLQQATVEQIKEHVYPLKTCNNICVAGGVAYNGYMNEEFTRHYTNVHVPPAVGDEGQALGTYMHADYVLNKNVHQPTVYSGEEHDIDVSVFEGLEYKEMPFEELTTYVANAIAHGKIVGWYQGKSESGNRALGNRSILADPRNPEIKDVINSKIKMREDFRPFAPSVLDEQYAEYFNTNQSSPYMSRIMSVKSDAVPGVTHIDGTARIQTVKREFNQRYYDLINEFYKLTGIPMLLNTSFNCQEPIVETPEDAVATFKKCGLDLLIIGNYVVMK